MGTLRENQYMSLIIYRSVLLRMRNISDKSCRGNQNTLCILKAFFFFRKYCLLLDNVEKYCRAGQASDDNTCFAHAHCMLDN